MQTSDSSWVTSTAAAPVPRFSTVPLPAPPRPPFPDPRQTTSVLPPQPPAVPLPPAGQPPPLPRFGAPPAAAAAAAMAAAPGRAGDGTETITVTNVVSAPAINKLGSLFTSLNKTVTGALNTFITQQQQQQVPGPWQPVGQPTAPTAVPVQQFPTAPLPPAVVPVTAVVSPQPPQRPPGAPPRLPSDASSAFVRVGAAAADWAVRPGAPPPYGPPPPLHGAAPLQHPPGAPPPPPLHNHVPPPPQPPVAAPYSSQTPPQFPPHVGEIHRDASRNHVDPRPHPVPAGRGQSLQQYSVKLEKLSLEVVPASLRPVLLAVSNSGLRVSHRPTITVIEQVSRDTEVLPDAHLLPFYMTIKSSSVRPRRMLGNLLPLVIFSIRPM